MLVMNHYQKLSHSSYWNHLVAIRYHFHKQLTTENEYELHNDNTKMTQHYKERH